MRSQDIRDEITAWTSRHPEIEGVEDQIAKMSEDDEMVGGLREAWSGRGSSNDNLWEAINYTLRTRLGGGGDADYYGLWRKHGRRFSVVDPGVEWVAALASLACPGPGQTTNVGIFMEKLRELGLRPELSDILARLERAGVAQGSADADQAVEIQSAF